MSLRLISYELPGVVYLLLGAIPIIFLFWLLYEHRQRVFQRLLGNACLHKLLVPRSRLFTLVRVALVVMAWIFGTLALMQPKGQARYRDLGSGDASTVSERLLEDDSDVQEDQIVTRRRKAHDVIVLLDCSASMAVKDTRTGLRRIDYAKEVVEELLAGLDGQSVGLYAFTSELTTLVPSTLDYLFFRLMLNQADINEGDVAGTDLAEALEGVRRKHFSQDSNRLSTLLILTDGGDTHLEQLSGSARDRALEAILSRVGDASALNLRIFSVGVGSEQGQDIPGILFDGKPVRSSLDEQLLQQLSEKGRGRYYQANAFSALGIAQDIRRLMAQDPPVIEEEEATLRVGRVERQLSPEDQRLLYTRYYQYPLFIALVALGIALVLPDSRQHKRKAP